MYKIVYVVKSDVNGIYEEFDTENEAIEFAIDHIDEKTYVEAVDCELNDFGEVVDINDQEMIWCWNDADFTEETHARYAKPEGDRVKAYNNALKYAKQNNTPYIYGYLGSPKGNVKFFALDQPIKCLGDMSEEEKKFRAQYKNCDTVYVAYPGKSFIQEADFCGDFSDYENLKESAVEEIDNPFAFDDWDCDTAPRANYDIDQVCEIDNICAECEDECEDENCENESDIAEDVSSISTVVDLLQDEFEAIDGYDKAIETIETSDEEKKDDIIADLQHIRDEEAEHVDELKEVGQLVADVSDKEADSEDTVKAVIAADVPAEVVDEINDGKVDIAVEPADEAEEDKEPFDECKFAEMLEALNDFDEDEVECGWCGEMFPKSDCRKELDLGYLCPQCIAAIKSRGEDLTFKEFYNPVGTAEPENNYPEPDNAVVDCDTYTLVAHSEDEKPLDCKMEKKPLEKPLTESDELKSYVGWYEGDDIWTGKAMSEDDAITDFEQYLVEIGKELNNADYEVTEEIAESVDPIATEDDADLDWGDIGITEPLDLIDYEHELTYDDFDITDQEEGWEDYWDYSREEPDQRSTGMMYGRLKPWTISIGVYPADIAAYLKKPAREITIDDLHAIDGKDLDEFLYDRYYDKAYADAKANADSDDFDWSDESFWEPDYEWDD